MPEQTIEDAAMEIEVRYITALKRHGLTQKAMSALLTTDDEKVAPSQINRAVKGGTEPKSRRIRERMNKILDIQD
ncbi:hypothetical protein [Lactobacillus brevis] [Lactiplantibacillus mudanjiangensis]|uniref:hypothetical protein n=1 Tax=Lactiplantibacillus mudanjiangensis TaxID=1296538 RepID=UPI0010155292|nr:hypothetical protein [Lactiplantibacillus mudanjiangensis]VDG31505.1 hypothetical protein [Lactobacillus brevis] [Lactiplantibacillus mudanjiangensis]